MKLSIIHNGIRILVAALAAHVVLAAVFAAPVPNPSAAAPSALPQRGGMPDQDPTTPAAPKLNPAEEAAYKAFYTTSQQDAAARIQLGEAFIQKYPTSRYDESVYGGLVQAYYLKQDWTNFLCQRG